MAKIEFADRNNQDEALASYSHKSQKAAEATSADGEPRKKLPKGSAVVKPKKGLAKVKATLTSDAMADTFFPVVKKAAYEILKDTIQMVIFGEVRRDTRSGRESQYVSYRDYADRNRDRDRGATRDVRRGIQLDDVYFKSRIEAEELIEALDDIIYKCGSASVFDLYDTIGADTVHTDNKYGWYSVRGFRVVSTRDGFRLDMPRPQPL